MHSTILLQQLEAAKKQGLHIKAASEMEYYAFRETYAEARRKNYHVWIYGCACGH